MKKFLVCLVCATILCSCGSDKEVFESWKGWVAMNTCSYDLQEEFKKEYANKGDLSSLFYENETSVVWIKSMAFTENEKIQWTTDDLSHLGSVIYEILQGHVDFKYTNLVENSEISPDDTIVMDVIKNFINNRSDYMYDSYTLTEDEDGTFYVGIKEYLPDSIMEKYNYDLKGYVRYNVDWLFRNENNLKTLANDLLGLCGSYSDFYDFVMDSVSVLDSEWIENRAGSDVYDVIYQIDAGDLTKYALCQILVNDENSEIQLINSSDSLMDLY